MADRPSSFISIADWPRESLERILARASELKLLRDARMPVASLAGRSVLLYFEKPSLRTYVSFGVGVSELGGTPVYLPPGSVQFGGREVVEDVARNLSRYCHLIVARTFEHALVQGLAEHGSVPVINALTDDLHPCQAMADALTIQQHGDLARDRLVYIGDGNNMAHSLINLAGVLGMQLTVCTPPSYAPNAAVVESGRALASTSGGEIQLETDPQRAVRDAEFVYTDVWASMGQESQAEERRGIFEPYQVNAALLAHAPPGVKLLHCLPAHRGEEVSAEVFEAQASIIFDQAENRLHAQKAIMEALLRSD
jgi:ornithine carbamoyltransferase